MANKALTALLFCYAIISFPYVVLALELGTFADANARTERPQGHSVLGQRSNQVDVLGSQYVFAPTDFARDVHVNSTSITYNIPEHLREVFYFRNHTLVGKKSEGFDIAKFDKESGHPDRSSWTPAERLAAGDSLLTQVFAGVVAGAALVGLCVLVSASCGTYIGANTRNFVAIVNGLAPGSEAAGEAAGALVNSIAGGAPAAIPGPSARHAKRDWELYEEFGCYYENGWDGNCENDAVTGPACQAVVEQDGADENTPISTCYESADSDGTIFGYYSHCLGDDEDCELQCGVGSPEVTNAPGSLGSGY